MRFRFACLAAGLVIGLAALAPLPARAFDPNHPCRQAISCDCPNISAGILTGGWKADCNTCETQILDICEKNYPPIGRAIAAGGYCEHNCSVTGPNPYPKAPPKVTGDTPPPEVFGHPPMLLACPLSMTLTSATIDGHPTKGCLDKRKRRQGVWVFVDDATGQVVEIVYVDGREVARTTRPKA